MPHGQVTVGGVGPISTVTAEAAAALAQPTAQPTPYAPAPQGAPPVFYPAVPQ